jgi:ferric-dicitrate binding protein FerR (iron transport regulator)
MSVLHEFKPKKPLRYDLENLNRYARKPVVLADQITLRNM